jgi:alpha-mannosidase
MGMASTCAATDIELIVRPWYKFRADGQPGREVSLVPVGGKIILPATVILECEGSKETVQITNASDTVSLLLPANVSVNKECQLRVTLQSGSQQLIKNIVVPAKRQWTVYIYPHAHVDIGYTALQETVEKLQVRNIDVGIDLARKTQNYPEGARFVWNPEATWIVSSYLKNASVEKKKAFAEAVQKGWIQIDAGHSNINTSICSDEEQMRLFRNVHSIQSITGVPITTMVQMDLPGAGWGMVQTAAQNGVHGFISFPNYYDVRKTWEHKPFYWVGPDSKSRILFLQAFPYGIGYTIKGSKYGLKKIQTLTDEYDRLQSEAPLKNFIDPFIFEETAKLERARSPYDIFAMTWSMADNCLIDADLPEAVRSWNSTYAYPKLIIAGSKQIIEAYEKKYAAIIPAYRGDFTEYWTDGLGSDARRVALSRRGKEDLVQAETLWQMLGKGSSPEFNQAWENLLLAAEHTWGFQVTGTPMARQVEANKAAYFENAAAISKKLLMPIQKNTDTFTVINTLSWARSGLVELSAEQSKTGDKVLDEKGREVLSQRLTTGELVFMANDVPALGAVCYRVVPGTCSRSSSMTTAPLSNEFISLTIDEQTGAIKSLVDLKTNRELVNTSLNSYYYQTGVYNGKDEAHNTATANKTSIHIKEKGALIVSLLITSQAPGCNALTREVRLVKGERMVQFINTMNKIATREKEAIHFGFAFNIPSGAIRMDIPWGIMKPEYDQLPGANKNWLAFQRWIDISNQNYGVTFTALESPIVELGDITGTILDGARQADRWIKTLPATQTIFSWPVNNHWDTNFPPEQGGIITNTYCLQLHDAYDVVAASHFGMEQHRPLIALQTGGHPIKKPLLALDNSKLMIAALKASEDKKAIIVRLRSVSDKNEKVTISYPTGIPQAVNICMADEKPLTKVNGPVTVPPYGAVSLRLEIKRTNL